MIDHRNHAVTRDEPPGRDARRDDETTLGHRLARGEIEAQAETYLRHRDRVFTVVYRLVGNTAAAADLTHDAFIRAFERAGDFRGTSGLGTWIVRIAINLALKYLRRERWLRLPRPQLSPEPARPVSSAALDLDRAIRELPATLRTAFVLHSVEGHAFAEVASALGISEAACRQRVHRARSLLARRLSDHRGGHRRAEP